MMIGAVQRLRLFGALFPFLETEEDKVIRKSILESIPVIWHRKMIQVLPSSTGVGTTKYLRSCYEDDSISSRDQQHHDDIIASSEQSVAIEARLNVIDTTDKGPALQLRSEPFIFVDDERIILQAGPRRIDNATSMTKIVYLKDIDVVSTTDKNLGSIAGGTTPSGFVVSGRVSRKKGSGQAVYTGAKLLLLEARPGSAHSLDRDEIVQKINTLVQWNKEKNEKPYTRNDASYLFNHETSAAGRRSKSSGKSKRSNRNNILTKYKIDDDQREPSSSDGNNGKDVTFSNIDENDDDVEERHRNQHDISSSKTTNDRERQMVLATRVPASRGYHHSPAAVVRQEEKIAKRPKPTNEIAIEKIALF